MIMENKVRGLRPDYVIKRAKKGLEAETKPVFVLEAKRIEPRAGQKIHNKKIKTLQENLPQMFEYLRLLCLEHQLPKLNGVLTNY